MPYSKDYKRPATTAREKVKRLKHGYPLGPGGKRVTAKPPKTSRGKKKKETLRAKLKGEGVGHDAEAIQERLRVEKELGLR